MRWNGTALSSSLQHPAQLADYMVWWVLVAMAFPLSHCTESWTEVKLPSCADLDCQGGTRCVDNACRSIECADLQCPEATVCQDGPLCLAARTPGTTCDRECDDGYECRQGPLCRPSFEDLDRDGALSMVDCDDGNPQRYPAAQEQCDGLDNDCNGAIDDNVLCPSGQTCCGLGGCVDLTNNRSHCQGCGRTCDRYDICRDSSCVTAPAPRLDQMTPQPLPTGVWLGAGSNDPLVLQGEHLLGYGTLFVTSQDNEGDQTPLAPVELLGDDQGLTYSNDQPLLFDAAQLPSGRARLRVERGDGQESNELVVDIAGAVQPVVSSLSPALVPVSQETTVTVNGQGFWGAARLQVAPEAETTTWTDLPVRWADTTWIQTKALTLEPDLFPAGPWLARVRNPDGTASEGFAFDIGEAPTPALTGVTPADARVGQPVQWSLQGANFFGMPTVHLAPLADSDSPLLEVGTTRVTPHLLETAPVALPENLVEGSYLLWVVNPDGQGSNRMRFVITD